MEYRRSQSGFPENKSPSTHTEPASIASRSVWLSGGKTFLKSLNAGPVTHCRRNDLT